MKLFVWDFHGVLEKDNELAALEISNQVLEQAGYKERFVEADNQHLYGRKWYQYFEYLLPKLSHEQHMQLQDACFKYGWDNIHTVQKHLKPNDHAQEVIKAIKAKGHDQIIVSNSRQGDIIWFINAVGLSPYFPESKIFGVNAHEHHDGKIDALKHYLKGKKFDDLVIIGDSPDDMALKNVAGGVTYFYKHPLVAGNNNSIHGDHAINDLREVLNEV